MSKSLVLAAMPLVHAMPSGKRDVPDDEQQEEPQKCKRQRHEESTRINGSNEEEKEQEFSTSTSTSSAPVVRAGLFQTHAGHPLFPVAIEPILLGFLDFEDLFNFRFVISTHIPFIRNLTVPPYNQVVDAEIFGFLRQCTGLKSLDLRWNNNITDFSPLRTLTGLTSLDLRCNDNLNDI